ncbi:unnamed protein product [Rotaria sp. Silwood2]|nr:unnamed protein product [Rotaria sp. Silwood2]
MDWTKDDIRQWADKLREEKRSNQEYFHWDKEYLPEMMAIIVRTVELYHGYHPRNFQLIALGIFLEPYGREKGRLGNISTGEGKSLITAMLAAAQALIDKNVDIVTSSQVLAIRNASDDPEEGYKEFFHLFGLKINNNCDDACENPRTGDVESNKHGEILIMDKDTGVEQLNTRWSNRLHQFLQLKHCGKLNDEGLKAIFMSNMNFFKLYKNLNGITGTIGGQEERKLLSLEYEVDCFELPRFRKYRFQYEKKKCEKDINRKRKDIDQIDQNINSLEETIRFHQTQQAKLERNIQNYQQILGSGDNRDKRRAVLIICENIANLEKITAKVRQAFQSNKKKISIPMIELIEKEIKSRIHESFRKSKVENESFQELALLNEEVKRKIEQIFVAKHSKFDFDANYLELQLNSLQNYWAFWLNKMDKKLTQKQNEDEAQILSHHNNAILEAIGSEVGSENFRNGKITGDIPTEVYKELLKDDYDMIKDNRISKKAIIGSKFLITSNAKKWSRFLDSKIKDGRSEAKKIEPLLLTKGKLLTYDNFLDKLDDPVFCSLGNDAKNLLLGKNLILLNAGNRTLLNDQFGETIEIVTHVSETLRQTIAEKLKDTIFGENISQIQEIIQASLSGKERISLSPGDIVKKTTLINTLKEFGHD